MEKDERDLLEVLIAELQFLEKGGYERWAREPWRPQYIFEDSPTCMNYDSKDHPAPCSECVLMQLVPPEFRGAKIPCRHIPFNSEGESLDSLYRWADQPEIEGAFRNWLRSTISRLEEERGISRRGENKKATISAGAKGVPLYQKLHPKCANPTCPKAFHWLAGGRFFRFRAEQAQGGEPSASAETYENVHGMKHYWLCEECSSLLTLVYEEGAGVEVKPLRMELRDEEPEKSAAAHAGKK